MNGMERARARSKPFIHWRVLRRATPRKETACILAYLGAAAVINEMNETGSETEQLIQAAGGKALFVQTDGLPS
jgi:hypothetical protein